LRKLKQSASGSNLRPSVRGLKTKPSALESRRKLLPPPKPNDYDSKKRRRPRGTERLRRRRG
jgi:hypothetical protein